jgi:NAD(P)-dependent dehydrogenase (short-subunit alcohol dehydrogenase family)
VGGISGTGPLTGLSADDIRTTFNSRLRAAFAAARAAAPRLPAGGSLRPHRLLRNSYLATLRRPLMRALTTGDTELLGNLEQGSAQNRGREFNDRYFELVTSTTWCVTTCRT